MGLILGSKFIPKLGNIHLIGAITLDRGMERHRNGTVSPHPTRSPTNMILRTALFAMYLMPIITLIYSERVRL